MIFVFEDNEEDIISKFFRKAYPVQFTDSFVYANGNGNIKNIVSDLLKISTENIVVYMDMIPGNKETAKIYKSLRDMSFKSQYRLVVLPVVCMEYYLVKSLKASQVMKSQAGVDICINKDVYFDSPLIVTDIDKSFVKNFEKYCKLILIKNLKKCASHSGKTTEIRYGKYYLKDCFCQYEEIECIEEKLLAKVERYVS